MRRWRHAKPGSELGELESAGMIDLDPALAIVLGGNAALVLLHSVIPATEVKGYACDGRGEPLRYRLNGVRVLGVAVACWAGLGKAGLVGLEVLHENAVGVAIVSCALGLAASVAAFVHGRRLPESEQEPQQRCATVDSPAAAPSKPTAEDLARFRQRPLAAHFYLGHLFNPRPWPLFDIKMYLYLWGAVLLELNVLSAAAAQVSRDGELSVAMGVYAGCMTWFVFEYLMGEEVHLATYDIFAEKIGFKLVWGCLCWYPNFYAIGAHSIVAHQPGRDLSRWQGAACLGLYLFGWCLTRGANMQKFWFKQDPKARTCFGGLLRQATVPGSRILCSGFWGLSRHINYLGETLQSVAVSLPGAVVGGTPLPFLYTLYYVALFVARQIDDDRLCAAKYGAAWAEYERMVPWRIVPWLY